MEIDEVVECAVVRPTRDIPTLVDDAINGLFADNKHLPPKYFYDDRGSELFDQICDEPEYYPTRTEDALLKDSARNVIRRTMPKQILEFGSGTSRKTVHLLTGLRRARLRIRLSAIRRLRRRYLEKCNKLAAKVSMATGRAY